MVSWNIEVISFLTAELAIGILTVWGNILVIMAVLSKQKLRTPQNLFIVSLASADFWAGVVLPPLSVLNQLLLPQHFIGCLLLSSVTYFFPSVFVLNLLGLTVDRFIAYKYRILYSLMINNRKVSIIIVLIWMMAVLYSFMPLVWHIVPKKGSEFTACLPEKVIPQEYVVYVFIFIINCVSLCIMAAIYSYILSNIRKNVLYLDPWQERSRAMFEKEVYSFSYVTLLFMVCRAPLDTLNIILLFDKDLSPPFTIISFFILLSHVKSIINPILYTYGNRHLRKQFKKVLPFGKYKGMSLCRIVDYLVHVKFIKYDFTYSLFLAFICKQFYYQYYWLEMCFSDQNLARAFSNLLLLPKILFI